jgi:hypothetical protein
MTELDLPQPPDIAAPHWDTPLAGPAGRLTTPVEYQDSARTNPVRTCGGEVSPREIADRAGDLLKR